MASILDFTGDRFERLASWARYLYWCELHRQRFDAWVESGIGVDDDRWKFVALLSSWYASLWVVIEGWQQVPLADAAVDEFLAAAPKYQDLLKRYRNGVYHYQPRMLDSRLTEFLEEGEGAVYWSHLIHEEFCRFYWELFASPPIPASLLPEFRETMIGIVGWIPDTIPAARVESLRQTGREAIAMLREAEDLTSSAAQGVLEAARQSEAVAGDTELRMRAWKQKMIVRIKSEADNP